MNELLRNLNVLIGVLLCFCACSKDDASEPKPFLGETKLYFHVVNSKGEDLLDEKTEGYLLENRGSNVKAIFNDRIYPLFLHDKLSSGKDSVYAQGKSHYVNGAANKNQSARNKITRFYSVVASDHDDVDELNYIYLGNWGGEWKDEMIVIDWGEKFGKDTLVFSWYLPQESEKYSPVFELFFNGKEIPKASTPNFIKYFVEK